MIGGETHPSAVQIPAQQFIDVRLAIRSDTTLKAGNPLRHDVVSDDVAAQLGQSDRARHSDVTGTDDADGLSQVISLLETMEASAH
jgi:hypothetical protein